MRLLASIALCLLLSGCYVNKASYDPFAYSPECGSVYWIPDAKAYELECRESEICMPDLPEESHELSLAEALDIALVNNPKTKISWAEARIAAANYGLSQSSFYPTITAEGFFTHSRTAYLASQVEQGQNIDRETLIVNDQSTWGPQAHVTWTLLDFGQRRYTSEAARYLLYYANFSHNRSIQTVIETVTLDYYNYLYEKKLLEADEADLANTEEVLAAAELGLKQGTKDISDVLQARSQKLLAEITLSEQYKTLNTAYARLLDTMGLPPNKSIKLMHLPFIDPELPELQSIDFFINTAMQCRPDLLAARADLVSTEMSLQAAKRAWTPSLDYSLDIGRTYFNGGFHDQIDYTSTITLSMPLFTGFHIRNTINQNRAKVEKAQGLLEEKELSVIQDITTAHYNVGVAYNTLKAANCFMLATKEQYVVALAQYRQGVNTILDVVSAATSLFDARAKQADAIKQWFSSFATLTYSTGILLYNIEDKK